MGEALKILVISPSKRRLETLLKSLAEHAPDHHLIGRLDRAINLPDWVDELEPDAIIMDVDSPSRDTLEQIVVMSESSPRPIVMFSQDDSREAMHSAVTAGVTAYVVDGVKSERLQPILQLAQVQFEAWQSLRDDMLRARQELHDHKLIEQAKRRLMKVQKLSEEAAYQALRREAMVQRKRLADVARIVMEAMPG
ncbi:MAG TPA: ANTAR domain-containing protein [Thiobacillaceae bacterium]|nr:ANTAR domain-containing protein [Thiobacillaceae bacterium]HNA81251.1 ANTAR domain-containing protein [Thiobacillaceae bacterium]HNF88727.1 ANTAR domain-containing protein [Thiobacillaceae bacterium]HNH88585.1 ANTAR domain-containing protein [Thiobacillaceae bacterium]HNI07634.1 ANTAR domain-containing protein [Thiobacillaceae bacterium]